MEVEEIIKLYYNYRRNTDADIRDFMDKIKLYKVTDKGIGTIRGYYEITGECINEIRKKPRGKSLTFDLYDEGKFILGDYTELKVYKKLKFLVKSSSRFFYKPDIGEIFDQFSFDDRHDSKIVGINVDCSNFQSLPNTEGEHFLCEIELLTKA